MQKGFYDVVFGYHNEKELCMKLEHKFWETVIDELNMMVVVISRDNTLISANKRMLEFAKVELDDIQDMALWDLPWWQHDPDLQNKLLFAINDSYLGLSSRFNATHKDYLGEEHEIDFIVKPVMKDGDPEYFIAMGYNISDLVSARKELTRRDRRIKAFFNYSSEGYFFFSLPDKIKRDLVTDEIINEIIHHLKIESFNDRLIEIIGQNIETVDMMLKSIGLSEDFHSVIKQMISDGFVTLEKTIVVNEETKHIQLVLVSIYDEENHFEGNFGIVRDITEQMKQIETITFFANKDYLTGINNRRNFFNEGNALFNKNHREKKPLTLVMFDIDHFKKVNDTYGHDAGDVVIREIAELVLEEISDASILGRYGGEEYIVLIPDHVEEVYTLFEKIREKIDQNVFKCEDKKVHVTVSTGLYAIDSEKDTLESSITKSDVALYESKENGRNQTTTFIESVHGMSSLDELTGLFTEESMCYKLEKTLYDVKKNEDTLWVIYFKLEVMKEDRLLTETRQLMTIAMCLKKSIRNSDYVGRIGKQGFLVVLRGVNMKKADDIHLRMVDNFEIGFSGMINNVIHIKSSSYNASLAPDTDIILMSIKKLLKPLY